MNIILDAMGGDLAPKEAVLGAVLAIKEYDIKVTLVGDEKAIKQVLNENNIKNENIIIVDAPKVVPMDLEPTRILKDYSDSSLAVGLKRLADGEGDAFVSAGSTGALLVGGTFIVKRIKGVKRPALGTLIPTGGGQSYLLIDAGANHDCRADMLNQFAIMGSAYYGGVYDKTAPTIGLVNIGSEEHKGDPLRQETFKILKENKALNFIGNIEARELPTHGCDVAVCDGFTGNIILKLSEGYGKFFVVTLKKMLTATMGTKIAALLLKSELSTFKKLLDYKEQGGAPLLGVRHPVIKAHGSSDARAFKNALRQAVFCCKKDVVGRIGEGIANTNTNTNTNSSLKSN